MAATSPLPLQTIGNLIETARFEFYAHAFPQRKDQNPDPSMAPAFLSASLTRAQIAAEHLGLKDAKAAFEILGTTPSIVKGLKKLYAGEGPPSLAAILYDAQSHHQAKRNTGTTVFKALSPFGSLTTPPDIKRRDYHFGN